MIQDVDSGFFCFLKTQMYNLSNYLILCDGFKHFDRLLFSYANKLVDINTDDISL